MQISHDTRSYDPDPGPHEKSTKKSCVSFETECTSYSSQLTEVDTHGPHGGVHFIIHPDLNMFRKKYCQGHLGQISILSRSLENLLRQKRCL